MKKIILLLTASVSVGSVMAQSNAKGSIVFNKEMKAPQREVSTIVLPKKANNSANKGTATTGAWFNYNNIMTGTSSKGYYNVLYQDSTVFYTYSSGTNSIFQHGFGRSFDPTDSAFFGGDNNGMMSAGSVGDPTQIPPFKVQYFNAYTIDSVAFPFKYHRNDNTHDDTLYIELVKRPKAGTGPAGTFVFHYSTLFDVTPDGKAGFGTVVMDTATVRMSDSIPSASKMVIKKVLDDAFFKDTATNGLSNWAGNGIQLPSALSMNAGDIVIMYATVKSGKQYPLGTNANSANWCRFYSADIAGVGGSPKQNVGSVESGLIYTRQNKYQDTSSFLPQGHNTLLPAIAYNSDGNSIDISFHVNCPTCWDLSASKVNNNFNLVKAYPNPASTEVSVSFRLNKAADVNVTLTNTVGQVVGSKSIASSSNGVAVFPTSGLANGVYFYTVEANGQRETGRVVVSH